MNLINKVREFIGFFFIFIALLVMPKFMRKLMSDSLSMGLDVHQKAYAKALEEIEESK